MYGTYIGGECNHSILVGVIGNWAVKPLISDASEKLHFCNMYQKIAFYSMFIG